MPEEIAKAKYLRMRRSTQDLFRRLYAASKNCSHHTSDRMALAYEAGYQDAVRAMFSQLLPGVDFDKFMEGDE